MKPTWFFLLLCCALLASAQPAPGPPAEATVIYLVRHAEKQLPAAGETLRDPDLTEAGQARAQHLAHVLGAVGITHIFSSDYRRTRQTAAPLAEATGLPVALYNPRDLTTFARQLRQTPGRHLVVGHSNTTPPLVALLGGEAGPPIEEAHEYDRLYVVILPANGPPVTLMQRFGTPAPHD